LRRFWRLVQEFIVATEGKTLSLDKTALNKQQKALRRDIHQAIEKVTDDLSRRQTFNTAVARVMELLNSLQKAEINDDFDLAVQQEGIVAMIKMLNPITPHICESLWQALGQSEPLQTAEWPSVDKSALVEDEKLIVVQVNGKVRAKLTVAADIDKGEIEQLAQSHDNVQQFIADKTIRKVIYVPGRLVNIVAN
jgi:leucyl-tRNA synthetase